MFYFYMVKDFLTIHANYNSVAFIMHSQGKQLPGFNSVDIGVFLRFWRMIITELIENTVFRSGASTRGVLTGIDLLADCQKSSTKPRAQTPAFLPAGLSDPGSRSPSSSTGEGILLSSQLIQHPKSEAKLNCYYQRN